MPKFLVDATAWMDVRCCGVCGLLEVQIFNAYQQSAPNFIGGASVHATSAR